MFCFLKVEVVSYIVDIFFDDFSTGSLQAWKSLKNFEGISYKKNSNREIT